MYGGRPYGDIYKRGSYDGHYDGGYWGDGFNACGMNLIPIIACVLLLIVYSLFIPGFAAPYWVSYEKSNVKSYQGLWRECTDLDTSDSIAINCNNLADSDAPDWLTATQALMCIVLINLVLPTALLVYWLCSRSKYFLVKVTFICLLFLAFFVSVAGILVYGLNATQDNKFDFDWGFYLVNVSTSVMLFVPILLVCVPARRMYPSFGPQDRFGFEYPPPMPPLKPIVPRPAIGIPAHVYPNSLPRTYGASKPYGSSYPGGYPTAYPSMPYSNRY